MSASPSQKFFRDMKNNRVFYWITYWITLLLFFIYLDFFLNFCFTVCTFYYPVRQRSGESRVLFYCCQSVCVCISVSLHSNS